jgi:endoglucanase
VKVRLEMKMLAAIAAAATGLGAAPTPAAAPAGMEQAGQAARPADPEGDWVSTFRSGGSEFHLALHFRRQGGALSGTADAPEYGAFGMTLAGLVAEGGRLSFDLPEGASHFTGAWDAEKQAYVGQWSRQGQAFPLSFARGKLPPPAPVDWDAPVAPGLAYAPAPAARATTGIALPVGKCSTWPTCSKRRRKANGGRRSPRTISG